MATTTKADKVNAISCLNRADDLLQAVIYMQHAESMARLAVMSLGEWPKTSMPSRICAIVDAVQAAKEDLETACRNNETVIAKAKDQISQARSILEK